MRFIYLLFYLISCFSPVLAQKKIRVASPNGRIVFTFTLTKAAPVYHVTFDGKTLVDDSELTLNFQESGLFGPNLSYKKPALRIIDETYDLTVGKVKTARNHCREAIFPLTEKTGNHRQINLTVRVFDDGIAFRYEFPKQPNWPNYVLMDENSTFRLAENPTVMTLFRINFTTYMAS